MQLTVGQLAQQAKLPPDTVRYYARIGLILPMARGSNGYKHFAAQDVQRLHFIRQAQRLGFTLTEIRGILQQAGVGASPCPQVREIIARRIDETRRQVRELVSLQKRMEDALACWENLPDRLPTGHSVCHLIESVNDDKADSL